jgi:sensor histidine kinase regulating citrate/malate metabolism
LPPSFWARFFSSSAFSLPRRSYRNRFRLPSCFGLTKAENISNSLIWGVFICCSLYTVLNIIIFYFVEHIYNDAHKDFKLDIAQEIIKKQAEQYRQLLESNREIMAIRHDYNIITTGFISEIKKGNYDIVLNELYQMKQSLHESAFLSSNLGIVQLIVNQKATFAKKSNITIDFESRDLCKIVIPDIDLSIILGNALDNAIEATQKITDPEEKHIDVKVSVHNSTIVAIIRNPVVEDIDTDLLETTKKDSEHHGIGILSMKEIASKYNGEILFTCQNNTFEVRIFLQNFSPKI